MNDLKIVLRKDIPGLLADDALWEQDFLAVSKHRLMAHFENPNCSDDDVVLILAYYNGELAGYMGVFTDFIALDGQLQKIGWLSTWWVHPKTKGSGIGREILNAMYETLNGKIGISQFTPSAKRVYDKSGYFYTLKQNKGVKAVLRSNMAFVLPALYPKLTKAKPVFDVFDNVANVFVNARLTLQKQFLLNKLSSVTLSYLTMPDGECMQLISDFSAKHLSPKTAQFFKWMKADQWVQEAPLVSLTDGGKYEFSMYDTAFNIYLVKINAGEKCVGFIVLQRRAKVCKLLFAYYDKSKYAQIVANVIKLQCIEQGVREIICYDDAISDNFRNSFLFLYRTKKLKESIISKAFGKEDFTDVHMNFGDGDCSFA